MRGRWWAWLRVLSTRRQVRIGAKMALAAAASYALASTLLGVPAPAAALLPLVVFRTPDPWTVWRSLFGRLLGVLLGVAAAVGILAISAPSWWWVALAVVATGLIQAIPRVGTFLVDNWQIAISAVVVLCVGPGPYGSERLVESLLGAGVTVVVALLVWPPDPAHELGLIVDQLAGDVQADLRGAIDLVGADPVQARQVEDAVLRRLVAARQALADVPRARRSLRASIYRFSRRVERIDELALRLRTLADVQHVVGTLVHAVYLLDVDARHPPPPQPQRERYRAAVELVATAAGSAGARDADLAARLAAILGKIGEATDPWSETFEVGLDELARQLAPQPAAAGRGG